MITERHERSGVRYCVVIPAFQEEARIAAVVSDALRYCGEVFVVDDGSKDRTAERADLTGALVFRNERNEGKGMALKRGFQAAMDRGCEVVITFDGDGQHDPADIPKFKEAYERTGIPVLIGNRMADPRGMPLVRRQTNRFMSWILSRNMGQYIPDTQCGYRLYRLDLIPFIGARSAGYAAESEILLHIASRGIRMGSVRISAHYGGEASAIRPLRDTWRFFSMLRAFRRSVRLKGRGRD